MRVTLSLGGLQRFNIARAHKRITEMWEVIYLTFLHKRFLTAPWPERKRHYEHPLLMETKTLLNVIDPRLQHPPGSLRETHGLTLEIGYGTDAIHPKKRKTPIAEIAGFHQRGTKHMVMREIIVLPDDETHKKLVDAAEFIYRRELKKAMP